MTVMSVARSAITLCEALESFRRAELASETAVLLAANNLEHGERNKITVIAVVRRPGSLDARFRSVRIGRFSTPDAASEELVIESLRRLAGELSTGLVVRPPGPGCALADEEWILARGPAPVAPWTVECRVRWFDEEGIGHDADDVRETLAQNPGEACRKAAAERGRLSIPGTARIASLCTRVRELDERWPPSWAGWSDPMTSSLDRATVRRLSASALGPTAILAEHPPRSPLDGMCALADAWSARLDEVIAAGAFLRGESAARDADAELTRVRAAHEDEWLLTFRIAEAIARDEVEVNLVAMARRAGGLHVIQAFREAAGLGLGQAKMLVAHLDELGARVTQPGTLSRALRQVTPARA